MEYRSSVLTYPFSQIDLFPVIYKYSIAYHFSPIPTDTLKNKSTMPVMPMTEDFIFAPDKEVRYLPMDVYSTNGDIMIYVDFAETHKPVGYEELQRKLKEIDKSNEKMAKRASSKFWRLYDKIRRFIKGSSDDNDLGF